MSQPMHPAATHHLPPFVVAPGDTDVLFVFTSVLVLLGVVGIGVFYFKLHALPEHLAHRGQKVQFEIVAVLALIALFTHNYAFWIAALLLAVIPLPDITTPLKAIARSLERIAAAAGGPTGTTAASVSRPVPRSDTDTDTDTDTAFAAEGRLHETKEI
jgi:hypothetical protein